MPADDDDWRLGGQEFMHGVTLRWRPWRRPSTNPDWDHDHCTFCWADFRETEDPYADAKTVTEGYTTTSEHPRGDGYHWVCATCFDDFVDRFQWRVVDPPPSSD